MNHQRTTKQEKNAAKGSFMIRLLTLPPLLAALTLFILHSRKGLFPGGSVWAGLFFLTILPLLSYPICYVVPKLRKKGRPLQRKAAVLFSVIGYLGGTVYCLAKNFLGVELMMFLAYLLSGSIIAVMSGCFRFKCSGHASGMAGPITLLGLEISPICFLGYGLLAPVFSSSLKLKRHTKEELVTGALIPAMLLMILTGLM